MYTFNAYILMMMMMMIFFIFCEILHFFFFENFKENEKNGKELERDV
jgi:hypothetical protein